MSEGTLLSEKTSYPVRIGAFLMYCENFKAVGTRGFSEKGTVSGDTVVTNSNRKALRLTFEGRIYDGYVPLRMLVYTDAFMTSGGKCSIEYRGVTFTNCSVQSFTTEDKGEDYIYGSVTLVTEDSSKQSGV